jgi:hypothetical protein
MPLERVVRYAAVVFHHLGRFAGRHRNILGPFGVRPRDELRVAMQDACGCVGSSL